MDQRNSYSNIPPSITTKVGRQLHNRTNHPIEIIKKLIYQYFDGLDGYDFCKFDDLSPIVSVADNFDRLLIPTDHPARSKSDTYYVNEDTVLRTHTSAHQNQLLAMGKRNFLVTGDVYRKDEIDRCHYPVFHQMEGVGMTPKGNWDAYEELLRILGGLVNHLFPGCEYRVNDDYFPFTDPSIEIEVKYNGEWLEILGGGVMQSRIAENNNAPGTYWAFGLGLERLAMILFKIPDIRYFWSEHPRFLDQFSTGKVVTFTPYSELPSQHKDISFWIPYTQLEGTKWTKENEFFELVREVGGDIVEQVTLQDSFVHPKTKITSHMYRILYSPRDPDLNDPSVFTGITNGLQEELREKVPGLNVKLR
jgi:phenylalanyl-tRNA synthetase alpha chain